MTRNPVLVFASTGHFVVHFLIGLHATTALAIERDWAVDYGSIVALWVWGAFALGAAAPAAGWLADRIGAGRMMVLFFIGSGGGSAAASFADGPLSLSAALAALGLFAAIYHPVGLAWLLDGMDEARRGRAVGVNGLFGSLGVAAAPPVAGFLSDGWGWRGAYLCPGVVSMLLGLLLALALLGGKVPNSRPFVPLSPVAATMANRSAPARALVVLAVAMVCSSLLYAAFTTALPKWAEIKLTAFWPDTDLGMIGSLVGVVFLVGGFGQVLTGHLSDRYDPRDIYAWTLVTKPLLLLGAAFLAGPLGLVAAALTVFAMDVTSPSESLLLARWTPAQRRGLAFGIRHAIALAAAPGGVWLAAISSGTASGLGGLFVGLAGLAAVAACAAILLPKKRQPARNVLTASSRRNR
ncbi:MAG: hypothetical protein ABS83_03650 [Rhodospirillales bacterium SCN 65-16]|nr:MAG: hypothetical protein ABS83_03650 [Rhodospirillales bacterium SCN 65-16]